MLVGYHFLKSFHYGLTPRKIADILKTATNFEIIYIDRSIFGIIAKLLRKNGFKLALLQRQKAYIYS